MCLEFLIVHECDMHVCVREREAQTQTHVQNMKKHSHMLNTISLKSTFVHCWHFVKVSSRNPASTFVSVSSTHHTYCLLLSYAGSAFEEPPEKSTVICAMTVMSPKIDATPIMITWILKMTNSMPKVSE